MIIALTALTPVSNSLCCILTIINMSVAMLGKSTRFAHRFSQQTQWHFWSLWLYVDFENNSPSLCYLLLREWAIPRFQSRREMELRRRRCLQYLLVCCQGSVKDSIWHCLNLAWTDLTPSTLQSTRQHPHMQFCEAFFRQCTLINYKVKIMLIS